MSDPEFTWGPLARGTFIALLWFIPLIAWHYPAHLTGYVLLLIFLALGLRPALEVTGLYDLFAALAEKMSQARWRKFEERRRAHVARRERDRRYSQRRVRDPRLPKNW